MRSKIHIEDGEDHYISNPVEVFGDLEIEKAFTLFERHNYSGARLKLQELKEVVPDPNIRQQLEFVHLLSGVYEAWDALEFRRAHQDIILLNKAIKRDKSVNSQFILMDFEEVLQQQESILAPLDEMEDLIKDKKNAYILSQKKYMVPLMFTMLQNASIREEQEKLDMATLLLYRLLEMIEQSRLSKYNLYVSKMDYRNTKPDYEKHPELKGASGDEIFMFIKDRYMNIKKQLFGKAGNGYLPEQVSLLEGFILLLALYAKSS